MDMHCVRFELSSERGNIATILLDRCQIWTLKVEEVNLTTMTDWYLIWTLNHALTSRKGPFVSRKGQ